MRDYEAMRAILSTTSKAKGELHFGHYTHIGTEEVLEAELSRLERDGLLDGDVHFASAFGDRSRCSVSGLTDEGREFFKLIENDDVWEIIRHTLDEANVDISYPLLKEVCEEIVKRYVTSFIPKTL